MSISALALTAKKVIEAAWLNGEAYDLATQGAEALESAQLLQSPEVAAEFNRLRVELAQRTQDLADTHADRERLKDQLAKSETEPEPAASFFRPGRSYTRDLPFRAPEDRPNFDCVGVGMHPSKGARRAFGFEQPGHGQPWVSASQRDEEWADGWIDLGPLRPDRLTRTFAPTQALRENQEAGE